jgi:hypothetical protein
MAKPATKKDDGNKRKTERQTAQAVLITLEGMDIDKMTDKQVRSFISVLGKLMGLLDDKGKVRPIT